jgi:hypothetical protein
VAELGQIERPSQESFAGKKKLYCVHNVYVFENAPDGYKELFNKYWDEVFQQIEKIEAAGKINKIFCESIFISGTEALDVLSKMNEKAAQIVNKKLEQGGTFVPLESREIFGPFLDWGNCLMVVRTNEVFEMVREFYTEWSGKRLRYILEVIQKNLSEGEAGLLLMKDEDRVKLQFPKDIEVFLVTPPSYDDLVKWVRERTKNKGREKEAEDPE